MSLLFTGATVIDRTGTRRVDVRVADGRVSEVADTLSPGDDDEHLDVAGLTITPGFVDLHTHLREPGREEAETIETGSRAAAKGGYTAVVAMPNTDPTQDCVSVVDFVREQGRVAGLCDVHPSASITVGRAGEQLTPFAQLAEAGVRLFTDDGNGVQDPLLMRRAFEYAKDLGVTMAQHCEVERLTGGAVMHEGDCCSHLGLPGWPSIAEELMVHRDIELVRLTGAPAHFLHLSTSKSVDLVRAAKADGLPVTAEATPHHISLTDELLRSYSAIYKVNPPLRTMADVEAVRAGVRDGTIDAIATDHAPHVSETKERPLDEAPPGMLGLETALGVCLAHLDMPVADVVAALSWKPAAIAGLGDVHGCDIAVGEPANLTVFDADVEWEVIPAQLASKSRNTPFVGVPLRGRVIHTVLAGTLTVQSGNPTDDECSSSMLHGYAGSVRHRSHLEASDRGWCVMNPTEGQLVLADGSVFEGDLIGAAVPVATGEVVFNTCLSGYQEVITDPSYAGQIITFTYPHIGNYGINATDFESVGTFCRGVVVRDLARRHSNFRAQADLGSMLFQQGVPGIAGIDTRRLTRIIRDIGAIPGAFGSASHDELLAAARDEPGTDGIDLVRTVTTPVGYTVDAVDPDSRRTIVAVDFGMKRNIAHNLARYGRVHVVPASTTAAEILAHEPDGVFLSNGPGDPAMSPYAVDAIGALIGEVPIFGICLGHQLLSRAIGADTVKLPFGHHGANHPVKNLMSDRVEITSQNHNFAVDASTLPANAEMTHVNLNDDVCEGIRVESERAFSVQHHPEANPGPHDSNYLFQQFADLMDASSSTSGSTSGSAKPASTTNGGTH